MSNYPTIDHIVSTFLWSKNSPKFFILLLHNTFKPFNN